LPSPAPAGDELQYSVYRPAHGELHRLVDNLYPACRLLPVEQRFDIRAFMRIQPELTRKPTLSGALVPWIRYSPLPMPKRSA
jgi:hypothetical protein